MDNRFTLSHTCHGTVGDMVQDVGMKFEMARAMVDAMQNFAKNIQKTSAKQNKKGAPSQAPSRAAAYLAERAKSKGMQAPETKKEPDGGTTPPASGGADNDYGDIFH